MIHEFRVRWYQQAFHRALVTRSHNRLLAIWHRRAGKDEVVLHAMREVALKDPGTYWHCFPEHKQARKAIWNGVNGHTGKRRIDEAFPPAIRKRMVDDDMFIELINGATFQLLGSDRYDATVGAGPKGIGYSEWALSNPAAWAYHQPMIRETGGFAAFITTPRGNNHAKTMFDRAMENPKWFCERLTVEDTRALSQADLDEALDEYVDLYGMDMGRAFFEQEYLCSFSGATIGAIFGAETARAEREGRLRPVEIDPDKPVHTVWDLGKAANNPIWCFQMDGDQPRVVDFYVPDSDDLDDWIGWLDEQGYYGKDYVPHDIQQTDWGIKRTRMDRLKSLGRHPVQLGRVSLADTHQAARAAINAAIFHYGDDERGQRVEQGFEGLKAYRREYDDERKCFRDNPVKDWSEHYASAFRYLGVAYRSDPELRVKAPPKRLVYEVGDDGRIQGNMSVAELVRGKERKRKRDEW